MMHLPKSALQFPIKHLSPNFLNKLTEKKHQMNDKPEKLLKQFFLLNQHTLFVL